MQRFIMVFAVCALSGGSAAAQVATPKPIPFGSPADAPDTPKPKHRVRHAAASVVLAADPESLDGKTLLQNGRDGEMQIAKGPDGKLQLVKFSLMGEVVANTGQRCKIDIVADKPLEAVPNGAPDGLPRFSVDIPACPLTFDIVAGGVLAPSQSSACVFAAAACQASPSGLWGPTPAELEKDPKAIAKARAAADRSIQDSLKALERRDKDAAPSLAREESDFAAERDDICASYAGEAKLGFCASRLQQSRAALLAKRLSESGPAPKSEKKKKKHKS